MPVILVKYRVGRPVPIVGAAFEPMLPRVLLVNPPIHDFTAYDFWLRPYGLLTVGGALREAAEVHLFDFLDRLHPAVAQNPRLRRDRWGRGEYPSQPAPKPRVFAGVPRRYRRFGLDRACFGEFLHSRGPFDFALVQTVMTYWYPGVAEVIADLRAACPQTKIVLGGLYATLCPRHAESLGADRLVQGPPDESLWRWLGVEADPAAPPFWEGYPRLEAGVLKLTDGCPFRCTYCCVPGVYGGFSARAAARPLAELDALCRRAARNVAFYDDALLYRPDDALLPFLAEVGRRRADVAFHTPNALHARFLTPELAGRMVQAGFRTFYLGFESASDAWQRSTGGKVSPDDLAQAVERLRTAGAGPDSITVYLLLGHPRAEAQQLEASMRFAHGLGVRLMLAEFSPIPGTPDGEACGGLVDMNEPLWHNKTVFAMTVLGRDEVSRLKHLCRRLNEALPA